MNSHIYNQLIRVYTGACKVANVQDVHVEQYCADAWALFEQVQEVKDCEVSVELLNSLLQLHVVAVKPSLIEAKVLPLYAVHKIEYDQNTYAHLARLYLDLRDMEKVVELFDKSQEAGLKPVNKLLASYLEAGLRKQSTETIIHALTKFKEIGQVPHHRVLKQLSNLKQIPDELFVILRRDFRPYGPLI